MNTPKFLLQLVLTLSFSFYGLGQELPKIFPPNPEAASMGKYGDIPIGTYTGVPNISIPLLELSGKGTSIPVSLNYHASGIRVNEMASKVGLGWSLNVGGSITRSIRGLPDDYVTGYLHPVVTVAQFLAGSDVDRGNWISNFSDVYDFESDLYHYNFPGHSGKFYMKQDGTAVTLDDPVSHPKDDIKIVPIMSGTKITRWEVTTSDGTKYYLGVSKDGSRQAKDLSTSFSTNGTTVPDPPQAYEDYTTAWHLMDIETVDKSLTSFSYAFSNVTFWNLSGQQKEIPKYAGTSSNPVRTSYSFNTDKVHRVTSISNNRGSIEFQYNQARVDLKQDYALTDIILKDPSNNTVDAYEFTYGYFTSTTNPHNSTFGDLDQRRKRLYLQNVKQRLNSTDNKVYSFTYDTSQILPDRFSFSQDFWGYYNGQNNSLFYPRIEWNAGVNDVYTIIPGADRKVYEGYAKACSLTKITYPTGGYTEFEFESNKIGNIDFFGMTETQEVTIHYMTSQNSSNTTFEQNITISDPDQYIGGINWKAKFYPNSSPCSSPGALDCPKAELYKKEGGVYQLISSTNGTDLEQGIVFTTGQPLELKIKLYNYFDAFPGNPRKDISAQIYGRELIPTSQNGVNAGGLRVKSIKNYDADNTLLTQRDYSYVLFSDPQTTSGAALNPPTFVYENMLYCDGGATGGPMDLLQSNSIFPLTNGSSYTACYTNVTELISGGDGGKIEYTHQFVYDGEGVQSNVYATGPLQFNINTPLQDFSHRRGLLLSKKVYAKNGSAYNLVEETTNSYNPTGENLLYQNVSIDFRGCFGGYSPYHFLSERFHTTQTTLKRYHASGDVTKVTSYGYDPGYTGRTFPIEVTETDSKGNSKITRTYFSGDKSLLTGLSTTASAAIDALDLAHRIAEPLQTKVTIKNSSNVVLSEQIQRTNYKDWGNSIIFPEFQQTSKMGSNLQDRVQFHSYYTNGNPKEVSLSNGTHVVYLWGYDDEYPVAKIENATYAEIMAAPLNLNFSVLNNPSNEGALRTEIEKIRNGLPNVMVTTYTYDPQVGVTSITDPRGYTTTYEYDTFKRLSEIKDHDGNILSHYQYNYKN